jgi:(R,R)-butanediol dehydrogenase/meso-butanediol dehydrogenase/diacetyl reductase
MQRAAEMGFETLESADDELPRRVRRATGGGGADLIVETTGSEAVLAAGIRSARKGGRIVLVAMQSRPVSLITTDIVLYERSIIGSLGYNHDLPRVLALMKQRVIDANDLISDTIYLRDAKQVIKQLAEQPDGRLKVLVQIRGPNQ